MAGLVILLRSYQPSGKTAYNITKILSIAVVWSCVIAILGKPALPGGNFWGLCIITAASMVGEEISKKLRLPGLLGMLIAGFMLQNIPGVSFAKPIDPHWSSAIRSIALVVILHRGGLSLDMAILKQMKHSITTLSFGPPTLEALAGAFACRYLLDIDWIWAYALGYLLCGVSPAVLVPAMLNLQEKGLGVGKGIPSLMIAACSITNAYCIQLFTVLLSVGFSNTTQRTMLILQAPVDIAIGLVFGLASGVLMWYLPHSEHPDKNGYRAVLLLSSGILVLFGGNQLGHAGAGPLACIVMSFVAGYKWRQNDPQFHKAVSDTLAKLWRYLQPALFGLIGAALSLDHLETSTVGLGIAIIFIGFVIRAISTLLATTGTGLNMREKIFTVIALSPKATVQAALGSKILDHAGSMAATSTADYEDIIDAGTKVLTVAVLSIILTAPLGAIAIRMSQNRLLSKKTTPVAV